MAIYPDAIFVNQMERNIIIGNTFRSVRPEWGYGFVRAQPDAADAVLEGAWHALERSGVLRERGLIGDEAWEAVDNSTLSMHVRGIAARTAPGLRSCALARCASREAHPAHFKRCGGCSTVVYCSKEHQVEDWPGHKAACKAARNAAAQAHDAAGPSGAA